MTAATLKLIKIVSKVIKVLPPVGELQSVTLKFGTLRSIRNFFKHL